MKAFSKIKEWKSKSALLAHIESSGSRAVLIGIEAEAPREFYSFSFQSGEGPLEIGVVSSGLGTKPEMILLQKGQKILVGHDTWLTGIDVHSVDLIFRRQLNGVFYEFLPLDRDDQVVVLHELGALRATAEGEDVWAVDTDVIEKFYTDAQGNIVITVMDQEAKIVVSLESGKAFSV